MFAGSYACAAVEAGISAALATVVDARLFGERLTKCCPHKRNACVHLHLESTERLTDGASIVCQHDDVRGACQTFGLFGTAALVGLKVRQICKALQRRIDHHITITASKASRCSTGLHSMGAVVGLQCGRNDWSGAGKTLQDLGRPMSTSTCSVCICRSWIHCTFIGRPCQDASSSDLTLTAAVFLRCLLTSAMGLSIWASTSHMHLKDLGTLKRSTIPSARIPQHESYELFSRLAMHLETSCPCCLCGMARECGYVAFGGLVGRCVLVRGGAYGCTMRPSPVYALVPRFTDAAAPPHGGSSDVNWR
ncbi:hypothetical protein BU25DRAFT_420435 [Macroventuria anomochaeta]|uniref:Uncharacterized protein n=1 Tax=Macroventuria anomochaeta TaxID=301207 RepID=A0ACB6S4P5_9PLEO|nr:uncharacterized protein BU25DRAFT_420435 [Macroventuria anomochaeta]KAF2629013.1 hypothetical protein BU25DRAFT_420435 [Macroventuria anomochaeta]